VAVSRSFAALDQQSAGAWGDFGKAGDVGEAPFVSPIANFYMTCPISRSSRTMAECVASRQHQMAAE
jgi:NADH-quinone oxidoreductase subunit G